MLKSNKHINVLFSAVLSLIVFFFCACPVFATPDSPDPKLPHYEKLTYAVKWMGVPVGTFTASIKGIKNINGHEAYILEATVRTNAFASMIHKIDDRFVSYLDAEKFYTLRHEVYRRETGLRKEAITDFDQLKHKAAYKNLLDGQERVLNISKDVQDILSLCYYFMLAPMQTGALLEYSLYRNEASEHYAGLVQSKVLVHSPVLGNKRVEAFQLYPFAQVSGKSVKKGNTRAFFSCGRRRYPLFAIVKGPVFTDATVYLVKIEHS